MFTINFVPIAVSGGGKRGNFSSKFPKFGQNYDFSGSDIKNLGKNQKFSGSDNDQLQKIVTKFR